MDGTLTVSFDGKEQIFLAQLMKIVSATTEDPTFLSLTHLNLQEPVTLSEAQRSCLHILLKPGEEKAKSLILNGEIPSTPEEQAILSLVQGILEKISDGKEELVDAIAGVLETIPREVGYDRL